MPLLGTIGGGEALDACCLCPMYLVILGTFVAAGIGWKGNSKRAIVLAVMLAGFEGIVALALVATAKPVLETDSLLDEEQVWLLFGLWVITAIATAVAGVRLLIKRFYGARNSTSTPASD